MKNTITIAFLLTLLVTHGAAAQLRPVTPPPRNWVSVYATMFTNMSDFNDPDSDSRWGFQDNAFGVGAALLREFGQGLLIGVDVSAARPDYERRTIGAPETAPALAEGKATVATALLTGRYASGGAGQLGFYLTGGIGTIAYNLEDLDGWNSDFALRAGTGLEYRFGTRGALALEWGRIWGYHEKEGVSGGRVNHSNLKLGVRFGF